MADNKSSTLIGVLHDPLTHGPRTGYQWDNWDALKKVPGAIFSEEVAAQPHEKWSRRLNRYIDTRVESDECVFCGRPIDPDTAYHNTICRHCV